MEQPTLRLFPKMADQVTEPPYSRAAVESETRDLTVSDNGVGFTDENFESFETMAPPTRPRREQTARSTRCKASIQSDTFTPPVGVRGMGGSPSAAQPVARAVHEHSRGGRPA